MADLTNRLSHEQKIGLVLLSAFVLLAVTLGLIQMRNTIYKPFALNTSIPPLLSSQVNTPDALRYRDTDGDGLNDFDELYVYGTSPYLEDTDSDGISDYDEVMSGKNPLCPEGQDCAVNITVDGSTIPGKPNVEAVFDYEFPSDFQQLLMEPNNIRMLLLEAGLDSSLVEKLSDQELTEMANEIFSSDVLDTANTSSINVGETSQFINEIMTGNISQ